MAAPDYGRMKLMLAGATAFGLVYGWAWFATNAPAEATQAAVEPAPVSTTVPAQTADPTTAGGTATATATAAKPTPTPVPTRVKKSRGS